MSDQHFLIVGGSHGIGLGIVRRLLRSGAAVTMISRTLDSADREPGLTHVRADVMHDTIDPESLPEAIDGMVYCPGSIHLAPVRQLKPESMIEDFQLNVVGAIKCLQVALPAMRTAGASALVLFSSVAVSQGLPMHASVSSAKGAVEGLTRSLSAELAPGIRVNCIAPALTSTPLSSRFLSTEQKRIAMAEKYPLKRVGEVEDIAAMAEFLLSRQSSWITGQVFAVDGGMSTVRV